MKRLHFLMVGLLVADPGVLAVRCLEHGLTSPDRRHAGRGFQPDRLEGKSQSLSQYRGKIVLVNFWATWCKPCTTEMPAMQASLRQAP